MISYKEKLNHIRAFMFDVDGVLTNGDVTLIDGDVIRTLNSRDGYALQYASKMDIRSLLLPEVILRM